ncbi:MAG: maleylpyruvate isomerase family mycothiol-dependent enzyme [Acidimicrobiales bacterium]
MVAALAAEHADLSRLLATLDEPGWDRPSRCDGWTVSDVVLHLAQTDELAIASATGRFNEALHELARGLGSASSVDDGADLMVSRERGRPGPAVRDRWQAGATALCEALSACEPSQRVTWVAGELSARTLATTRLAETWIHAGDVAAAFGQTPEPTDRLWHIARLAWRTLPYAFARSGRELTGPVAFELRSPGGETWDFFPDTDPLSVIRGDGVELGLVAARRVEPEPNVGGIGTPLRPFDPEVRRFLGARSGMVARRGGATATPGSTAAHRAGGHRRGRHRHAPRGGVFLHLE